MPDATEMLTEMQNLAESLPSRVPSVLRVGPYVAELLLRLAPRRDNRHDAFGLLLGVAIVNDDTYAPGEWRLFDQRDEPLHEGQIEALRGFAPGAQIHVSEYLPPGVAAIVIAPTALHPGDPGYVPIERRAVVLRGDGTDG